MEVFDLQGKISLDTKDFEKAVKTAKKQGEELGKGLQEQGKQFTELQKELGRLANELSAAQEEINHLRTQLNSSAKSADSAAESASDMADEVKKAKDAMDRAADSAEDLGEEEEKTSKKTDDYSDSAEDAKDKSHRLEKALEGLGSMASDVGGKIGNLASEIKDTLVKAAEVGAAAIGAASTAVAALTKSAVTSYGEYEQLVGGVDTLFGDSAYRVKKYADDAYKNAGMSANTYMETVTSFSASLLQGLKGDTAKAADIADMAIRDMSDNANKMGTDMSSIQNAYQGFAKQNYTMLDNLKLGYGGTKGEMARLLNYANQLDNTILGQGVTVDEKFDNVSFDSMIRAIHIVQEEMGIANTTKEEAAGTLQGSAGSMKAAWDNLVTGLARPDADLGQLITNFTESAETAVNNMVPIIEQALNGISKLVEELAPKIASGIPAFVKRVGPPLISAAMQLVKAFGNAILNGAPQLLPYITKTIKKVISAITANSGQAIAVFTQIIGMINDLIMKNLPEFIKLGGTMLSAIAKGLTENLPELIGYVAELVSFISQQISDNLPAILDAAGGLIGAIGKGILDNLPMLLDSAVGIISKLSEYLSNCLPELIPAAIGIIGDLAKELTKPERLEEILNAAFQLITSLAEGLLSKESIDKILEDVPKVLENIVSALTSEETLNNLFEAALTIVSALVEYLKDPENWWKIFKAAQKILETLSTGLQAVGSYMDEAAEAIIEEFLNSIGLGKVYEKGKEIVKELKRGIEDSATLTTIGNSVIDALFPGKSFAGDVFNYSGGSGHTGHARAKGGIITQPEIALIGEAGAEAVIPLENNTQWIDHVAERIQAKSSSGVVVQNLNINMDGMKIASDYDTERFVEVLSERLQALSVSQDRSVGGVGW